MRALLAGEMRRVVARRLVRVTILLFAVGVAVAGVATFVKTHQLSDAAYQARVQSASETRGVGPFGGGPGVPLCGPGQNPTPATGPNREIQPSCLPRQALGVHDPRFHVTSLRGVLQGVTAPLVILSCLIGASVIGAEWSNRTITTILTWESRRRRVFGAKLLAALVVTVTVTLVGLVVLGAALYPSALLHGTTTGTTAGADAAFWRSVGGVLLRAMAMSAIGTTIGFSIASVGRNTAAALGVLFGYVVVIERVVAGLITGWQRWLIIVNAAVLVSGRTNDLAHGRTAPVAGLYLTAVAVGLYLAASAVFERRDVA